MIQAYSTEELYAALVRAEKQMDRPNGDKYDYGVYLVAKAQYHNALQVEARCRAGEK